MASAIDVVKSKIDGITRVATTIESVNAKQYNFIIIEFRSAEDFQQFDNNNWVSYKRWKRKSGYNFPNMDNVILMDKVDCMKTFEGYNIALHNGKPMADALMMEFFMESIKISPEEYLQSSEFLEELLGKYNIWDGDNALKIWDKFYKEYYDNIIDDEIKKITKLENVEKFYISQNDLKNMNIKPFDDYKKENRDIYDWARNQVGGNFNKEILKMLYDNLGIVITAKRSINSNNKKVISLCLFNNSFISKKTPYVYVANKRKPFHFYSIVLSNVIDTYRRYLPSDWIIRLYVDDTIPIDDRTSLPLETNKIIDRFLTEDNMELYNVNFPSLRKGTGHHYGLLAVLFRYLSFFDQDITCCFIGDVDNTCTVILAEILKKFCESPANLLIFKPTTMDYSRDSGVNCVSNFLAGMLGFSKKSGDILNPHVWLSLFRYINYFYKKVGMDKDTRVCSVTPNYDNPFYYGFEENALTSVFSSLINKLNISTFVAPFHFDYGITRNELNVVELENNKYFALTPNFQNFIVKLLKLEFADGTNIFSELSKYRYLLNIKNLPASTILHNITNYYFLRNIDQVNYKGKTIKIFDNIETFKRGNGIQPFAKFYPIDVREIAVSHQDVSIDDLYGEDISTEIIRLIMLLEDNDFTTFEKEYDAIHIRLKTNILYYKNKGIQFANDYYDVMKKDDNMIIAHWDPTHDL